MSDGAPSGPSRVARIATLVGLLVLFAVLLVRCAWMSDDAFITMRTIDNVWHGYGPRWNVDERVQGYTHPLWMLLLLPGYGLTGEGYFSTLALSIVLSIGALLLVMAQAEGLALAALAAVLVAGSRAVVDYAACGLENPLLFLLLALLVALVFEEPSPTRTALLALLTALVALTRPDATLIALPPLGHAIASSDEKRRAAVRAAAGLVPLAAWEVFSLVYYGSLFSNTAWAKLNVRVPATTLGVQGLYYVGNSLSRDPLTLATIAAGVALALRSRRPAARLLAAGILLHLAAVMRIGGDFMSGRFFGGSFVVAAALVVRLAPWQDRRLPGVVAALVALVTLLLPGSHWLSGTDYGDAMPRNAYVETHGIADERAYYAPSTGLVRVVERYGEIAAAEAPVPPYRGAFLGRRSKAQRDVVAITGEVGFFGYNAGPSVHVVDMFALCDPLLARIPFEPNGRWRIGHFERPIPDGYDEVLLGRGAIRDPTIAALYDRVRLITRGPLFSAARWRAILGS